MTNYLKKLAYVHNAMQKLAMEKDAWYPGQIRNNIAARRQARIANGGWYLGKNVGLPPIAYNGPMPGQRPSAPNAPSVTSTPQPAVTSPESKPEILTGIPNDAVKIVGPTESQKRLRVGSTARITNNAHPVSKEKARTIKKPNDLRRKSVNPAPVVTPVKERPNSVASNRLNLNSQNPHRPTTDKAPVSEQIPASTSPGPAVKPKKSVSLDRANQIIRDKSLRRRQEEPVNNQDMFATVPSEPITFESPIDAEWVSQFSLNPIENTTPEAPPVEENTPTVPAIRRGRNLLKRDVNDNPVSTQSTYSPPAGYFDFNRPGGPRDLTELLWRVRHARENDLYLDPETAEYYLEKPVDWNDPNFIDYLGSAEQDPYLL